MYVKRKTKWWKKQMLDERRKEKIDLYHLNNNIGMDKCAKHFGIS